MPNNLTYSLSFRLPPKEIIYIQAQDVKLNKWFFPYALFYGQALILEMELLSWKKPGCPPHSKQQSTEC